MATIIRESLVDDVAYAQDPETEVPADETIHWSLDGREMSMDLSAANAEAFRRVVAPWAAISKTIGSKRRRTAMHRRRSAEIRSWAGKKGIKIGDRGRIPASVIAQYEAEH